LFASTTLVYIHFYLDIINRYRPVFLAVEARVFNRTVAIYSGNKKHPQPRQLDYITGGLF
jgi:hypothetical protein